MILYQVKCIQPTTSPEELQSFPDLGSIMIFSLFLVKQRRITRIFSTYSIPESITPSRNFLLLSESGCHDPSLALDSFTFFEWPFSPDNTKVKRKRNGFPNLGQQPHDSPQSPSRQGCNGSYFSMSQKYYIKSIHITWCLFVAGDKFFNKHKIEIDSFLH